MKTANRAALKMIGALVYCAAVSSSTVIYGQGEVADKLNAGPGAAIAVNVLAGAAVPVLEKLLSDGPDRPVKIESQKIGEIMPKGSAASELTGAIRTHYEYEVSDEDLMVKYAITYQHHATYKGHDLYVTNVMFKPLPGTKIGDSQGLVITAKSEEPVNEGSEDSPKFSLDFVLTFQLTQDGAAKLTTHRFRIRPDGKLIAVTPGFEE